MKRSLLLLAALVTASVAGVAGRAAASDAADPVAVDGVGSRLDALVLAAEAYDDADVDGLGRFVAAFADPDVGIRFEVFEDRTRSEVLAATFDPDLVAAGWDALVTADHHQLDAADHWPDRLVHGPQGRVHGSAAGVVVAVIDSGVDATHTAFAGRVLTGRTFLWGAEYAGQSDDHGHGTHVAGSIAGSHARFTGVAQGATILPVKSLDQNAAGYVSDTAKAIVYATNAGADVINMSLGGSADVSSLSSAVAYAAHHDVVMVSAMGNGGPTAGPSYPAAYPDVVAVGSVDWQTVIAASSQRGAHIDVVAPGVSVLSAWPGTPSRIATASGTSMASPHVAGAAAVLRGTRPDLTAVEIRALLRSTSRDLGAAGFDQTYGHGVIDLGAAVAAGLAASPSLPTTSTTAPSPSAPAPPSSTSPPPSTSPQPSPSPAPAAAPPFVERPLTRSFDTRDGARPDAHTQIEVALPGVPAGALVTANLTVVDPAADGYAVIHTCGTTPATSNVNVAAGETRAAAVVVRTDDRSAVCAHASVDAHLIVDTGGYWPAGSASAGVPPARILDTRVGGRLPAMTVGSAPLATATLPTGVRAITATVTVVDPDEDGWATVWSCDRAQPATSVLNFTARATVANTVTVPVGGPTGTVCVLSSSSADVLVDVVAAHTSLRSSSIERLLDSRTTPGHATTWTVPAAGGDGIVALNVTGVSPATAGWITVWPCAAPKPSTSNLNVDAGRTVANAVFVPSGRDICIESSVPTDLLVDRFAVL